MGRTSRKTRSIRYLENKEANNTKKAVIFGSISFFLICLLLSMLIYFQKGYETELLKLSLVLIVFLTILMNLTGLFYAVMGFKEKHIVWSVVAVILNLLFPCILLLLVLGNLHDLALFFFGKE